MDVSAERQCVGFIKAGWRWGVATMLACTLSIAALADSLKLNSDVPLTYVVKSGDTLWDISDMYLSEPWRWPELWNANPAIDNPHLIYPGDILRLQWLDGQPRLTLAERADVTLSPTMRREPIASAIPPIPRQHIDPFLRSNRVVAEEDLEGLAYVVAGDSGRLISALGDRVYARGALDAEAQSFAIVRAGQAIIDPVTDELLGYHVTDIGSVSRAALDRRGEQDADVTTLEVTRITEEVRVGDRLLPLEEGVFATDYQPKPPSTTVSDAFMVSVDQGVSQIGSLSIVTLNRGDREGIEVGDVLAIYQAGPLLKDTVEGGQVRLPDVRAGVLMIFSVYEKASYGLVLKANRPLAVGDRVENP